MTTGTVVYCERYGTKMMAGACAKFRENTPERCRGCSGPVACEDDITASVKERIADAAAQLSKKGKGQGQPVKTCTTDGCTEKTLAKGFCKKHYHQHRDKKRAAANKKTVQERPKHNQPPIDGAEKKKETEAMPVVSNETMPAPDKTTAAGKSNRRERADNRINKIVLNFMARDRTLLEELQGAAEKNRRTLSAEILFRLEHGSQSASRCLCSDPGMPDLGGR